MKTLKDLIDYDNHAQRTIKRWESDSEFRKTKSITEHMDTLTKFMERHIALTYYLLDYYIVDENGDSISLYEAKLKLGLLRTIRKVSMKEKRKENEKKVKKIIDEYEEKINTVAKKIILIKSIS